MKKWTRTFFTAVLGAAFVAGAAPPSFPGQVETKGKVQMGGEKSLYERLGGKKAMMNLWQTSRLTRGSTSSSH